MKKIFIAATFILSINAFSGHHEEEKVAAQGMISSDIFDLAGELDLHIEKYESCGQADGAQHFHPYGTVVYVLDGETTTNSSGSYKPVKKDEYWFERSNWVHGGADPEAPLVDDNQCSKMLIIRVAKKGESPTVFID
jgi:quercetin dioxygenase-like cupin family protein|tara:strand:- start:142 stop:552 length:411 start_codon:yes stop_codon:yes gene_type:complete